MTEFKIKAEYYGPEWRKIFFGEKETVAYHCFSIIENIDDFPNDFFPPSSVLRTRNRQERRDIWNPIIYCWLLISENLVQKLNLNFEKDKNIDL